MVRRSLIKAGDFQSGGLKSGTDVGRFGILEEWISLCESLVGLVILVLSLLLNKTHLNRPRDGVIECEPASSLLFL